MRVQTTLVHISHTPCIHVTFIVFGAASAWSCIYVYSRRRRRCAAYVLILFRVFDPESIKRRQVMIHTRTLAHAHKAI